MSEDVKKELEELKKNQAELDKLDDILKHLQALHKICITLGRGLIAEGEFFFGRQLIKNCFLHDLSKLSGLEWQYLNSETANDEPEKFKLALENHRENNSHHVQFHNGFENMPRLARAEMVADFVVRSNLMGTDIRAYLKDVAVKEFGLSLNGKDYKELIYFLDLIVGKPFKKPKTVGSTSDRKIKSKDVKGK